LSRDDQELVYRARRLERFLTQPFAVTEQFTGHEGKVVELDRALDGCEQILEDRLADVPERALYMIGGIEEAKKGRRQERADREEDQA
jgi:F-type H+-transporting ATPase subunit beta